MVLPHIKDTEAKTTFKIATNTVINLINQLNETPVIQISQDIPPHFAAQIKFLAPVPQRMPLASLDENVPPQSPTFPRVKVF